MKPGRETALELFDKAMETEREGIKVYEEAADKVQDAKAKEIFKMIAQAERKHVSELEKAKEAVRHTYAVHEWTGDFVSEIGKEIEAIGKQYLPKAADEIVSASALDAINMGIKLEEDSIAFYTDARTRVSDLGVGNVFSSLRTAERVHLFLFEMTKDIITRPKRA